MNATTANPFTSFVFALAASGTILGFAAAPAEAAPSRAVTISMHELASQEGRAAVDARIARAARQVCEPGSERQSLDGQLQTRACIERTMADTRFKVAALTQKHTQLAAK